MTKLRACLLLIAASVFLSGCQTSGTACDGWKPIRPTAKDADAISDRFAGDVLAHNEFGRKVCGWKPK